MKHLEASLHLTTAPIEMHELTATSEKNRRNEESKGIRDPVRSTGVIQQNHGWRDRASAVEGAARSEIQTPDDSSGACISDLVAPSRAGPRGTPWAGVPPAPVREFQPDLFDSSILRIFDITVSARSVSAAVAKDS